MLGDKFSSQSSKFIDTNTKLRVIIHDSKILTQVSSLLLILLVA